MNNRLHETKDEILFGSWVTLGLESVAETMSLLGHDYVGIDCQHGLIAPNMAARLLYALPQEGGYWPTIAPNFAG